MAYKGCEFGSAIGDVCKHPDLGIVTHQPLADQQEQEKDQPGYEKTGFIRVLDILGVIHWKPECECSPPDWEADREEIERYFREGKCVAGVVQTR